MADDPREYVARRPRHQAVGSAAPRLEVERCPGGVPESVEAELLDLSRSGVRFRTAAPLSPGESILVRLAHDDSELLLVRSGAVQWIRGDQEGVYSVGCHFDQPVEWETLGELFLNGILSTDRPSPKPEAPVPANAPGD
ncbi:MAG: PilZ domain-containing protein [Planctomycetota bacterium]